jgi:hypothetical protein
LGGEFANAFIDSRKLLGARNKIHSISFFIGRDIVGVKMMRERYVDEDGGSLSLVELEVDRGWPRRCRLERSRFRHVVASSYPNHDHDRDATRL